MITTEERQELRKCYLQVQKQLVHAPGHDAEGWATEGWAAEVWPTRGPRTIREVSDDTTTRANRGGPDIASLRTLAIQKQVLRGSCRQTGRFHCKKLLYHAC